TFAYVDSKAANAEVLRSALMLAVVAVRSARRACRRRIGRAPFPWQREPDGRQVVWPARAYRWFAMPNSMSLGIQGQVSLKHLHMGTPLHRCFSRLPAHTYSQVRVLDPTREQSGQCINVPLWKELPGYPIFQEVVDPGNIGPDNPQANGHCLHHCGTHGLS